MDDSSKLKNDYDNDQGLASKRKWLVNASAILLAISFSGAKIEEANTFIFKIEFTHQDGLGTLLAFTIMFFMIRYYSYAKPYQDQLYAIWTERLVSRPYFYLYCQYSDGISGVVPDSRPSKIKGEYNDNVRDWSFRYICGWPFFRFIEHKWIDLECGGDIQQSAVNIYNNLGLKVYSKCLCLEAREQIKSVFIHRENLDILLPYFIGGFAVASHFFNSQLLLVLKLITPTA